VFVATRRSSWQHHFGGPATRASERSIEFRAEVFVMPVVDEVRLGVSGE
jgi:hypothetical protein